MRRKEKLVALLFTVAVGVFFIYRPVFEDSWLSHSMLEEQQKQYPLDNEIQQRADIKRRNNGIGDEVGAQSVSVRLMERGNLNSAFVSAGDGEGKSSNLPSPRQAPSKLSPFKSPAAVAAVAAAYQSPSSSLHSSALEEQPKVLAGNVVIGEGKGTDLVVGVLTDPNSLRTVGMAVYTTWARELEPSATVIFFIGSCSSEVQGFPGNMVCLNTPDTYPPQRKVFLLWRYMFAHLLHRHKLFMKLDHDSYVNCPNLLQLTRKLSAEHYVNRDVYVGLPASGRQEERKTLGLNGKLYCSGLGYIVNRNTLSKIGPHLLECLGSAVSNHSDTEMGRCIFTHTTAECSAIRDSVFRQVYYQQEGNMVYPMKLIHGGQMSLKFLRVPKAIHFDSVILHPLKRAEDFYRFHKQTMSQLRPMQPSISKDSNPTSYRQAIADLRQTCVHNLARQMELYGYPLRECDPPQREVIEKMSQCLYFFSFSLFLSFSLSLSFFLSLSLSLCLPALFFIRNLEFLSLIQSLSLSCRLLLLCPVKHSL